MFSSAMELCCPFSKGIYLLPLPQPLLYTYLWIFVVIELVVNIPIKWIYSIFVFMSLGYLTQDHFFLAPSIFLQFFVISFF